MSKPTNWSGLERRADPPPGAPGGIPPEVVAYIDARISREIGAIHGMLREHIIEETRALDVIRAMIERNAAASEARHEMLMQKLSAHQIRTEAIEQAFLDNQHGEPDFFGHRSDHSTRANVGRWWDGVKSTVASNAIMAVMGGLVTWVALIVYQSLTGAAHP